MNKILKSIFLSFIFAISSCGSSTVVPNSITLNKTSLTLNVEQTETLIATVKPDNASDKSVIWSSSDDSGISVNENGLVTALKVGNYTVTCTANANKNVKTICSVVVSPAFHPVTAITLDKYDVTANENETIPIKVSVFPDNSTDKTFICESSDAAIASFDYETSKIVTKAAGSVILKFRSNSNPDVVSFDCHVTVKPSYIPVTDIVLNKTSLEFIEEDTFSLTATVKPDDASNKNISWSSSNPSVANINQDGLVTAYKEGTCQIICKSLDIGKLQRICEVKVNKKIIPVDSVTLDQHSVTVDINKSIKLSATVLPNNATDKSVIYSVDNSGHVSVSQNGVVTALSGGIASIKCTSIFDPTKFDVCTINVNVPVSSISLNKTSLSLKENESFTFEPTVLPINATNKKVEWSVDNEELASISDDGEIFAKKKGHVVVTCSSFAYKDITTTCEVDIIKPVESISLNKSVLNLDVNQKDTLIATVLPSDATSLDVKWESSNNDIASVSESGLVTAKKKGTCKIICTVLSDTNKKAECDINVYLPVKEIHLNKNNIELRINSTFTLVPSFLPDDTSYKEVDFISENPNIASVNKNGLITANSSGNTTITCVSTRDKNIKDTCSVTVIKEVTSISLDQSSVILTGFDPVSITASVFPNDATYPNVSWYLENSTDSDYVDLSVNNNVATITAIRSKDNIKLICFSVDNPSVSTYCLINVRLAITDFTLESDSLEIPYKGTSKININNESIIPEGYYSNKFSFKSNNVDVVTVDEDGNLTAINPGETTIIVKPYGQDKPSKKVDVKVNEKVDVKTIDILKNNKPISYLEIEEEEDIQLFADVKPTNAYDKTVIWTSDNVEVATVIDGLVSGLKKGTCEISATNLDSGVSTSINIKVNEKSEEKTYTPSDYFANYYPDDFSWTDGEDLKLKLSNLMRQKRTDVLNYSSSGTNWATNQEADHSENDFEFLDALYTSDDVWKYTTYNAWQREHAFCASLMTGLTTGEATSSKDPAIAERARDYLNLFAADTDGNTSRGNKNYGTAGVYGKISPRGDAKFDSKNFEPNDHDKGRTSRSIFYMATMYAYTDYDPLKIQEDYVTVDTKSGVNPAAHGNLSTLLQWADSFSVDRLEMQHNISVATSNISGKVQGNRNCYTDYPQLVDYVFGNKQDESGDLKHLEPALHSLDMNSSTQYYNFAIKEAKRFYKVGEKVDFGNDLTLVNVKKNNSNEDATNIATNFTFSGINSKTTLTADDVGTHTITIVPSDNNPLVYSKKDLAVTYNIEVVGEYSYSLQSKDIPSSAPSSPVIKNLAGVDFNVKYNEGKTYATYIDTKGLKFGTSSTSVEQLYFETANSYSFNNHNKIKDIYISGACTNDGELTVKIYINNILKDSAQMVYYEDKQIIKFHFDTPLSGKLKIVFDNPTKAFYLHTIAINAIS